MLKNCFRFTFKSRKVANGANTRKLSLKHSWEMDVVGLSIGDVRFRPQGEGRVQNKSKVSKDH
jgi:hypothetical protein